MKIQNAVKTYSGEGIGKLLLNKSKFHPLSKNNVILTAYLLRPPSRADFPGTRLNPIPALYLFLEEGLCRAEVKQEDSLEEPLDMAKNPVKDLLSKVYQLTIYSWSDISIWIKGDNLSIFTTGERVDAWADPGDKGTLFSNAKIKEQNSSDEIKKFLSSKLNDRLKDNTPNYETNFGQLYLFLIFIGLLFLLITPIWFYSLLAILIMVVYLYTKSNQTNIKTAAK